MRLRVIISVFLLLSSVFSGNSFATGSANTVIATTSFVEDSIKRNGDGSLLINNSTNASVALSQNPQTSAVTPSSTQVATVGWTDTNRTSKVRSGSSTSSTLVDIWVE